MSGEGVLNWKKIEQEISQFHTHEFVLKNQASIAGGSINQAMRIEGVINGEAKQFFIKFNQKDALPMFQAEADGLRELQNTAAISTPDVICLGEAGQSYLVLQYLDLGPGNTDSATLLGKQLAMLHKSSLNGTTFGWGQDNTIGLTPQINRTADNWIDFWREHRLGFQLELAKNNGASHGLLAKGEKLQNRLEALFQDYAPEASLLHGDLWSGNFGYLQNGEPVLFDPAVYYGDREADLAMTELFGGFPREFYAAYNDAWPLHTGYAVRKYLYNLYHILNHFNLFAGGYDSQAERMMDQLLNNAEG